MYLHAQFPVSANFNWNDKLRNLINPVSGPRIMEFVSFSLSSLIWTYLLLFVIFFIIDMHHLHHRYISSDIFVYAVKLGGPLYLTVKGCQDFDLCSSRHHNPNSLKHLCSNRWYLSISGSLTIYMQFYRVHLR